MRVLAMVGCLSGCGFTIPGGSAVDPDGPPVSLDTGRPDVPVDDCPSFYRALGTGRYMVIDQGGPFLGHHETCKGHLPGRTHLASITSLQEALELQVYVGTLAGNPDRRYYVGTIQETNTVVAPSDKWITYDGQPAQALLWSLSGGEPNDGSDDDEADHEEQVAALQVNKQHLVDLARTENIRAICECDGIPIHPLVADYLQQLPP